MPTDQKAVQMIELGRHSYNYGVQRGTNNRVIVGAFTSIAEGVIFDGGFNHDTALISTFPLKTVFPEARDNALIKGDIQIGNDVWIGEDAIIMSGVTIGDGAIIGARTIVTRNVEPYHIVAGAPMFTIRRRYDSIAIASLLKIRWWEWPDEKIRENIDLIQSVKIQEFINLHFPNDRA